MGAPLSWRRQPLLVRLSADAGVIETESLSLRRDLGDKRGIAECLEGHACRMTLDGQAESAIRVFATAAAMRDTLGTPGSPADRRRVQKHLELARAASEPERAAEAWRIGSVETLDDAVRWIAQSVPINS